MSIDRSKKSQLPRALRNCNPLNIRLGSNWKGMKKEQTDKAFCQFESMAYGWRAALVLIRNYITGYNSSRRKYDSIAAIISRWAPECENATQAYIRTVSEMTGIHYLERIQWTDRKKVCAIAQAMGKVESGVQLDIEPILAAYDLIA